MQITATKHDDITVLGLSGRMDATTVSTFEEAWRERFEAGDHKLAVDLDGVEYISSAGLRGILTLLKACKGGGCGLAFCRMGDMVAEVFRISGFTSMLSMHPTVEAAVDSLR